MAILRQLGFELFFAAFTGKSAVDAVIASRYRLIAGLADVFSRGRGVLGDSELGHVVGHRHSKCSRNLAQVRVAQKRNFAAVSGVANRYINLGL
jgi:hypothetical protein